MFSLWLIIWLFISLKFPSSFVPFTLYRTRIVESTSSLKSSGSIWSWGSFSKKHCLIIADFSVFDFLPICLSEADVLSTLFSVLSAKSIFDNPDVSFWTTIFPFVLSLSFNVLIILSTFPLPQWSRMGQIMCWMNLSLQNCWNFSPLNTVPGSVLILFGIPFVAMYSNKNSTTLSADGIGKNIAAGHPELLSNETSKYFFCLFIFWNGPAKSSKISSFGLFASGNFPNSFWLFTYLRFFPAFWHSEQFLAFSTISRWILGHHTVGCIS